MRFKPHLQAIVEPSADSFLLKGDLWTFPKTFFAAFFRTTLSTNHAADSCAYAN